MQEIHARRGFAIAVLFADHAAGGSSVATRIDRADADTGDLEAWAAPRYARSALRGRAAIGAAVNGSQRAIDSASGDAGLRGRNSPPLRRAQAPLVPYCVADAVLGGVVWTDAASLAVDVVLAAAPASPLARFAASLSPGVPRGLAELLMTPLLAWPIETPPFSAARLQPDAPANNATVDSAIIMFLEICRMIRSPWDDWDSSSEAFDMPKQNRRAGTLARPARSRRCD